MMSHKDTVNAGLPVLENDGRAWSWFEFLPLILFYTPVTLYWIWLGLRYRSLGLPMLANPRIPLGGMVGESKSGILDSGGEYASEWILPYALCHYDSRLPLSDQVNSAIHAARAKKIVFPMVAKPDLGCRGRGVRLLHGEEDLHSYLRDFPPGRDYLLQQLAPWRAEAGIFYVRRPEEKQGRITSITLKYTPLVTGDGRRSLRQLIEANPRARRLKKVYLGKNGVCGEWVPEKGEEVPLTFAGSHCRGSIFRDGAEFHSAALEAAVDRIMQDFPDFYYGRLDVKFRDVDSLQQGENFFVIEVNGASSEATHIWDSRGSLAGVFRTLFGQYRTLYEIGHALRLRGLKPPAATQLVTTWLRELFSASSYPEGQ